MLSEPAACRRCAQRAGPARRGGLQGVGCTRPAHVSRAGIAVAAQAAAVLRGGHRDLHHARIAEPRLDCKLIWHRLVRAEAAGMVCGEGGAAPLEPANALRRINVPG